MRQNCTVNQDENLENYTDPNYFVHDPQGGCGRLFMIATPIGNRGDLAPRAKALLMHCDLVLAEDTRRLLQLARELGIAIKRTISFHDHNEQEKEAEVIAFLEAGHDVALVSDAGTPLVADPGFRLVRTCRSKNIPVHPIPGPSAPVTALCASGIAPLPYTFLGFMPRESASQKALFTSFAQTPTTLIFFERKDRLTQTLALARSLLGPRQVAVCRELTKIHEEFVLFRLEDETSVPENLLGELTVIIGPSEQKSRSSQEEVLAAIHALGENLKPKVLARKVQTQVQGWTSSEIYALLIAKKQDD